ncbi:MAG TPA: acireductone synthase [Acidocella sp.]|jgi:enolase-phosphatase E1|nr:MAG: acireductone synthase [Acidocella sp. 20-58-15]OYY04766.1 MAG: acireductone synthase [Acidocella sp. 35-58-6]HQT37815.1 acireductone synthase [Acidocella sp.]
MLPPAAVLTDIEGTTTPIAFVHEVLFPYARARLPGWCQVHCDAPVIGEVARLAPGAMIVDTLLGWMDRDEKITPLKTIQGMIWAEGYAKGEIAGDLYEDVAPALRRWAGAGVRLYVYSSGSVEAQKLLFGHSRAGNLNGLFQGFFDTRLGTKRSPQSYTDICRGTNVSAAECLFLSDVEAELDAAAQAGLRTCQLVRPQDRTVAGNRHAVAADFAEVAKQFGLPKLA